MLKKGSSVGRVRMAFTHPQTTLVNYYVGGAGVGAVSTSNRRALRSRASWRPTQDGKGSTRCSGFCQPNRFANNVEFTRQGGQGAVNDKPEVVTKDDNTHHTRLRAYLKTGCVQVGRPTCHFGRIVISIQSLISMRHAQRLKTITTGFRVS